MKQLPYMKKNQNGINAKKARKAFKKELTDKIVSQLKAAVGEVGTDLKKTGKAIEKAAKNLAKKISKQAVIKKTVSAKTPAEAKPVAEVVPVAEKPAAPAKAKATVVKKTAAKAE